MKNISSGYILSFLGIWVMVIFMSSMGLNLLLTNLKWEVYTTMPGTIALVILPWVVGTVLTYIVVRELKEEQNEQKSKKKSDF
ncbi:hypothetical protein BCP78_0063 [Bacillus phage BCP78]|uniref:Uncharacterized protein n=3 Tax=Tsarbombavirus BCP78 TaxID=1985182 RepID=J9PRK7_9CAUD|nr:hypothetical protein BCP78_0063 [Bacillus phage BCP78]YP_009783426.1 hypothetical protein QLX27_gp053 [Bacillus phage BCU4]AQN32437.1 hypothetical protein BCP12_014 [Bacillus phage BCP12]QEG13614.1 hypothetical protein MARVELLAND_91 [Bacillus phage vB_BspM_MarvelLand]AEW47070.1 hypothetical protein BCP78_0063 [Bacillus phage BCP78]AEW47559.1 hypothetical protein BCU4_0053 [Bacillus phage BCU4]